VLLRKPTTCVPIVFVQVIDPVGAGMVASLARPGGNTTGFTVFEYGMSGKCAISLSSSTQCFWIVCGEVHERADAPHTLALLRPRRERPRRRCAAEQRDELASSEAEHGLLPGTRCASLPQAQDAPEAPRRSLG
jgi:hypothetical protein